MQMYLPPYRLRVIVLLLVLVAIFATVLRAVNTSHMKVSSHCIALPGNVMLETLEMAQVCSAILCLLAIITSMLEKGQAMCLTSSWRCAPLLCVVTHTSHTTEHVLFLCDILKSLNAWFIYFFFLFVKQAPPSFCRTHGSMLPVWWGLWDELCVTSTVCLHKQISSCLVLWKLLTVLCWIQLTWSVFIFTRSYVGYICECYKRGCFENSYYLTESVKKPFSLGSN